MPGMGSNMTNRYKYTDAAGEHLHTLDGRPLIGTSRVGSVLAKPLTWWASGLAVQAFGCPDPKVLTKIKKGKATRDEIAIHESAATSFLKNLQRMSVDDYLELWDAAYRAHQTSLKDKAEAGTDLHAEVERFVKDYIIKEESPELSGFKYETQIQPFIDWTNANVKRFLWSEGHCYSEQHWLGGISDIGYENNAGEFGIIDIKSSKEAYLSQFWQCAGYDLQISENGILDAEGNLLYTLEKPIKHYCIFAFGATPPRPFFFENPADAQEGFLAELIIYRKLPQD
jgi:hypothetical protein